MPSAPKAPRNPSSTRMTAPSTAPTAESNTKSSSTAADHGEYRLEIAFSDVEAESLAKGEVPPLVQDAAIGLLLAIRMPIQQRMSYIQERPKKKA
jgi:hypothetical protein